MMRQDVLIGRPTITVTRTTRVELYAGMAIVWDNVIRPPSFWYPGGYFAGRRAPISIDGGCGDETTWPN